MHVCMKYGDESMKIRRNLGWKMEGRTYVNSIEQNLNIVKKNSPTFVIVPLF